MSLIRIKHVRPVSISPKVNSINNQILADSNATVIPSNKIQNGKMQKKQIPSR